MINTVFLTAIGMFIVMIYAFWVSRIIGAVFLAMVPILGVTTVYLSGRIRDAQKNIVRTSAELAGATIENVKNVTLIKSLGLESQEVEHLNRVNKKLIDLEIEKLRLVKSISFWQGTLINFLRSLLQFIMLWLVFE
jgi:ATP-binding cassette subfamily B protein